MSAVPSLVVAGLREWQRGFLDRFVRGVARDFLLVATPGAGKTLAACHAAHAAGAEQVIVVTPTVALRAQWRMRPIALGFISTLAGATPMARGVATSMASL